MSFEGIKRVHSTFNEAEVNKALEHGWEILSIGHGTDSEGFPIQKFTMGHRSEKSTAPVGERNE